MRSLVLDHDWLNRQLHWLLIRGLILWLWIHVWLPQLQRLPHQRSTLHNRATPHWHQWDRQHHLVFRQYVMASYRDLLNLQVRRFLIITAGPSTPSCNTVCCTSAARRAIRPQSDPSRLRAMAQPSLTCLDYLQTALFATRRIPHKYAASSREYRRE